MIATRPRFPSLDDLIGRPYRYGARGPEAYDCWGLVLEVRRRLALPAPPDFATRDLAPAQARALFHANPPPGWRAVELRHGAIVYATQAAHAGVLVAGRVVHAAHGWGVVAWSLGQWFACFEAQTEVYEWSPASSSC
jgi:cell wall-associated NlpC family hydrolase